MVKINDYLEQRINSQFDGELIYLKIEGNNSVGYLSTVQYFNFDRLYLKKNNIELPDTEISHPGHSSEEFKFYNKKLLFQIENKLISFTHNKEIQSLELELFSGNTTCNVMIDEIEYFLIEINKENSLTYDFRIKKIQTNNNK